MIGLLVGELFRNHCYDRKLFNEWSLCWPIKSNSTLCSHDDDNEEEEDYDDDNDDDDGSGHDGKCKIYCSW